MHCLRFTAYIFMGHLAVIWQQPIVVFVYSTHSLQRHLSYTSYTSSTIVIQSLLAGPIRVCGQISPCRNIIFFHSKHCICQNV